MTVSIGNVRPDEALAAFEWHKAFAESDDHIFPRSWNDFRRMAEDYELVTAVEDGEFVGMCYYTQGESGEYEVGGLMVHGSQQNRSLGAALWCVTLGNLLIDIDPLEQGEGVIAHVIKSNPAPRGIITALTRFRHRKEVTIPSDELPGLKVEEDGMVHGDEFELTVPDTLIALATWCEEWAGELRDGTKAVLNLREGMTVADWAGEFRLMAEQHS
jgi:hypothetical protein